MNTGNYPFGLAPAVGRVIDLTCKSNVENDDLEEGIAQETTSWALQTSNDIVFDLSD